jgi:Transmembrane secretion effector
MPERDAPRIRAAVGRRVAVLRHRRFRRLYIGQVTWLLGTWMSGVALTFAVLGSGISVDGLGVVMAAEILPQVAFVLGGGVLADRIRRRPVMLVAWSPSRRSGRRIRRRPCRPRPRSRRRRRRRTGR